MNGDSKELLKQLKDFMLTMHKDNREDIGKLFSLLRKLPCGKHAGKMWGLIIAQGATWTVLAFILIRMFA